MHEFLWQTYHRLIADVPVKHHRFLYNKINLENRLTGVIGPRGTGKTTLLLQYIKEHLYAKEETFYFSADNIYFNEHSLLSFIDQLYQKQNIVNFFIDEIHKYHRWDQELKNIYDSYPKIKIVFSGSSSIDLIHGTYDLSRRARILYLPGLSFREFLNINTNSTFDPVSFEDILNQHTQIAAEFSNISTINTHFEEYKHFGYYPIVFEGRENLYEKLTKIIDKTIYEDIANFYQLKTTNLSYFKQIIGFLASIPPGEVRTNNLAKHIGLDNKTIDHYLSILNRTGMIKMLFPVAHGNQILSKPAKVYLDNTTLLAAANTLLSEPVNLGTQRELSFLQFVTGANLQVFYPKIGDFKIKNTVFEVGGKNKNGAQVKHELNKIIVKDNILIGFQNNIPLYLFGFLY